MGSSSSKPKLVKSASSQVSSASDDVKKTTSFAVNSTNTTKHHKQSSLGALKKLNSRDYLSHADSTSSSSRASIRRPTRLGGMGSFFLSRDGESVDEDPDDPGRFEMTASEAAFLSKDVRERVSQFVNGMLPPAPALYPKPGAAMFVDISGFTALGNHLRLTSSSSKKAAEALAGQITYVLNELTRTCLASGGDVAKFAGDALLCTFSGMGDEDECLVRAQNCAIEMLMNMRRYNHSANNGQLQQLQIHGGIAKGSILHFHLGSSDDELRWYLVAGDAVASAVALVDHAEPGQILLSPQVGVLNFNAGEEEDGKQVGEGRAFGNLAISHKRESLIRVTEDEESNPIGILGLLDHLTPPPPSIMSPSIIRTSKEYSNNVRYSGERPTTPRKTLISSASQQISFRTRTKTETEQHQSGVFFPAPTTTTNDIQFGIATEITSREGEKIKLFLLTAETEKCESIQPPPPPQQQQQAAPLVMMSTLQLKGNSIYDVTLHISGTAYIPLALRAGLRTGFNTSEMRDRVAVVFVGVPSLALSDQELFSHVVSSEKLDLLNQAFVKMTRISHSFEGEIRDLLFDDKGCIFIASFGAHTTNEFAELKACKCAMAISQEFPRAKIGVSVGTCFVGMCGAPKRHDFVVMGHEVNIAARCMVVASEGEVLVSQEIEKETREFIQYDQVPFINKKANNDKDVFAYRAKLEIARRPSFLEQYRYGLRDRDMFVGRTEELNRVETKVLEMCYSDPSHTSGVILLEAPAGMGKSAFVNRVKKFGKGRLIIASTASFVLEQENEFFVLRHLIESFTGFRRDMSREHLRRICNEEYGESGEALSLDTLSEVIPWFHDVLRTKPKTGSNTTFFTKTKLNQDQIVRIGTEMIRVFEAFRGELTLNQIMSGESTKGALLIIEDVQWMDLHSLQILKFLLQRLSTLRGIVFLLTTRVDTTKKESGGSGIGLESERSELVRDLLALSSPPSPFAAPIQVLDGLNQEDTSRLVSLLFQVEEEFVSQRVKDLVFARTQGFPMYVVSLLEWIKDRKLVELNADNVYDWVDPENLKSIEFPNTLSGTMLAKFDSLDVQTRNLLKIATCMATDFDAITLTTLANIDLGNASASLTVNKVLESLTAAAELGLLTVTRLRGITAGAHKWRFKHDTILQAIQSVIPTDRLDQLKLLLKPMQKEVEKNKLVPLFAGFLGEVDDDEDDE